MSRDESLPYVPHSDTSREAASDAKALASELRHRVYQRIARAGAVGMTDEQVQEALGMNPSTERPRRIELVRAGLESLVNRCQHQLAAGVQCRHRVTAPRTLCGQHGGQT